jgi:hypothetical protein
LKREEYVERRNELNPFDYSFEVLFDDWNDRFDKMMIDFIGEDDENYLGPNYKMFNQKVLGINNTREKYRRIIKNDQ